MLDPRQVQSTDDAGHAGSNGLVSSRLPAEFLEWARSQTNEEEIIAGMREIEETGGLELKDFIHELEQDAATRE